MSSGHERSGASQLVSPAPPVPAPAVPSPPEELAPVPLPPDPEAPPPPDPALSTELPQPPNERLPDATSALVAKSVRRDERNGASALTSLSNLSSVPKKREAELASDHNRGSDTTTRMGEDVQPGTITGETLHLVTVVSLPIDARERRAVETAIAMVVGAPLADARTLLSNLPVTLPLASPHSESEELVERLTSLGADAHLTDAPSATCLVHPSFRATLLCERCHEPTCTMCAAPTEGAVLCGRCSKKKRRSRGYFIARVTVLLLLLVGVLLYAWADVRRREARTAWKRPLVVAVVLVELAPIEPQAVADMQTRLDVLEDHLDQEMRRHRTYAGHAPFEMSFFGPIRMAAGPPSAPDEEAGLTDLAAYSWDLWRYIDHIDDQADLETKAFDSRIYLVARPPGDQSRKQIEGLSEQDGRIGLVEVDLDHETVDFALFVATHELFHTLGATDKYDAGGFIIEPDGLAEPDLDPLYPQRFAELMARHRATGPSTSAPPESIEELAIGAATAREIRWTR